ncbi:hypothetical protein GCM10009827_059730 [Dactylosporangium maewongense]|uniref:Uncharacterized protein n=1 Tax=Dactylosporangium maewongense TaxID=634393 RepID=A0ABN2B671_9ACTN
MVSYRTSTPDGGGPDGVPAGGFGSAPHPASSTLDTTIATTVPRKPTVLTVVACPAAPRRFARIPGDRGAHDSGGRTRNALSARNAALPSAWSTHSS